MSAEYYTTCRSLHTNTSWKALRAISLWPISSTSFYTYSASVVYCGVSPVCQLRQSQVRSFLGRRAPQATRRIARGIAPIHRSRLLRQQIRTALPDPQQPREQQRQNQSPPVGPQLLPRAGTACLKPTGCVCSAPSSSTAGGFQGCTPVEHRRREGVHIYTGIPAFAAVMNEEWNKTLLVQLLQAVDHLCQKAGVSGEESQT